MNSASFDLIVSSITEETPSSGSVGDVLRWMEELRNFIECSVQLVPLRNLAKWRFDDGMNLRHETGRFFSIEGISVKTNHGKVPEWRQPIICQPEIGFLGFICKKVDGVLHFLVQAKIEPGNVNVVQLSPTLQATRSNYTQAHKGARPLFLDYFIDKGRYRVVVDQLQSEQGARFFKKRNRNIVIDIGGESVIDAPANFRWLTLGQIKKLLRSDNVVNMDSRTVLASLHPDDEAIARAGSAPYADRVNNDLLGSMKDGVGVVNSTDQIISWFTDLKMHTDLDVESVGIRDCHSWAVEEYAICNADRKYFEVVGADIRIVNREVANWAQPLVRHYEKGIVGLVIKKFYGVHHLLIQAKMEPGNFDILEMAPTVQCITGSYTKPEYSVSYLDYFTGARKARVVYDSLQSEEGGRFYQEQNRYVVVELDEADEIELGNRYIWMTLGQAKEFIKFNNYMNVELRSVIASISPV